MSHHLLFSSLGQILVAVHQILDDAHHLDYKLPVLILLLSGLLDLFRILVKALNAVLLHPGQSFLVFLLIINAFRHTADDFHLVHGFHTHTKIILDKGRVNDGSADTHTDGTDLQVGFAPHGSNSNSRPSEAKQLFLHVLRNGGIVCFLYIMSVDTERRKPLLGMGSQYGGQIHCTGTLRAVEAPDTLDGIGIHVHCLCAVTPAGSNGKGNVHACLPELVRTCSGLSHPANGGVCNHNLHRLTVGVAQIFLKKGGCRLCHVHGLIFQ